MVGGAGTATYQWYASASTDTTAKWTEIEGEDDATISVTASLKDKFLKVVVTDEAGNEAEAETLTKVGIDASFDVELVDDYGLQSDGTAIIGDKLTVVYGATFGVPQNVSWYKDGKVVATNSVGDVVNNGLTRTITASDWGTGVYKVVITNVDGDIAETNEITVTDKEEAAEILDFDIEDDYTQGTNITYNATDRTAVATVTLSKNYDGIIGIYRKSDTGYTSRIDRVTTDVVEPDRTAAQTVANVAVSVKGALADNAAQLVSNMPTNNNILQGTAGSGMGYINNDGTVTYKFNVNGGLIRGIDYVVTFDQTSISTDTPGTGKANVFDEAATAPYVTVPASIEVTKVSNGNAPEITFKDEDGVALGWLGDAVNNTMGACGFNAVHVYRSTAKTNDKDASTVTELAGPTTNDGLAAGVWTAGALANSTAYWFASAATTAGIYGSGSVTLLSEAATVAVDSATDMDIIENKDTATTATVSFSNLRTAGTVYVVRGSYSDTAGDAVINDHYTTADNIFTKFDASSPDTYTASAKVTAGTASIDIPSAIGVPTGRSADSASDADGEAEDFNTDDYIAVFVPDDEDNFGMIYTNGNNGVLGTTGSNAAAEGISYNSSTGTGAFMSSLHVAQALKSYKLNSLFGSATNLADSATVNTGAGTYKVENGALVATASDVGAADGYVLEYIDQFGNHMNQTADTRTWNLTPQDAEMDPDATCQVTFLAGAINSNKAGLVGTLYDAIGINVTAGVNDTDAKSGQSFSATLGTGQVLKVAVAGGVGAGNGIDDVTYKITLS